ncbi:MAG: M43 family zinc metalloprotease [Reichenbachiella sp.]|uniref:M43 family zinc metalloprotease n=1 Tax=Reichenbachiella sp. TaxID=2184521 RepID=UPI0032990156
MKKDNCLFIAMIAVMFFCSENLMAQRKCGSHDRAELKLSQNPEIRIKRQELEDFTSTYRRSSGRTGTQRIIPVHVIVVYANANGNVSDEQIASQIAVLNEDFSASNSDISQVPSAFSGVTSNGIGIQFVLEGIERHSNSKTNWDIDDEPGLVYPAQSPSTTLNMWVAPIKDGTLGFATFPSENNPNVDGVVIAPSFFGRGYSTNDSDFDKGRTATHEVGHYLNLFHIWGDGGCNASDNVADTPSAQSQYTGCPSFPQTSCNSSDMFMNYMDYVNDACMFMFTTGQENRMWAALDGSRSQLGSAPENPEVTITSPANGAEFNSGATVWVNSTATGGTYEHVSVEVDGTFYANDDSSPYSTPVTGLADGSHVIKVYGKLTDGTFVDAPNSVSVMVGSGGGSTTYTEDFESMTLSGWGTETFAGSSGFNWSVDAKGVTGFIDASKGIYNKNKTMVTSASIPGGISSFTVKCKNKWNVGQPHTIDLLVNGTVVGSSNTTSDNTVYDFTVNDINVSGNVVIALAVGANTIAIDDMSWTTYDGVSGGVITKYEAEDGILSNVTTKTTGSYSGTGYCDYDAGKGSNYYIEWTVNTAATGSGSIAITYANAHASADRGVDIVVNGTNEGRISMTPTGGGRNWETVMHSTNLNGGNNTIRLVAHDNYGPNIDFIEVTEGGSSGGGSTTYTEDFEKMTLTGWGIETFTGNNNFSWTVDAKGVTGFVDASKGIYNKNKTMVTSGSIPGGISDFSVQCVNKWNSGSNCLIELLVNGQVVGASNTTSSNTVYTFSVEDINVTGDVTIALRVGDQTIAIDDITWTGFNSSVRSLVSAINRQSSVNEFNIYPNPLKQGMVLKIEHVTEQEKEELQISLINLLGHQLITQDEVFLKGKNTIELQIEDLRKGIYLMQIRSRKSEIIKRIMIE